LTKEPCAASTPAKITRYCAKHTLTVTTDATTNLEVIPFLDDSGGREHVFHHDKHDILLVNRHFDAQVELAQQAAGMASGDTAKTHIMETAGAT
jgi:hypothetical protein